MSDHRKGLARLLHTQDQDEADALDWLDNLPHEAAVAILDALDSLHATGDPLMVNVGNLARLGLRGLWLKLQARRAEGDGLPSDVSGG